MVPPPTQAETRDRGQCRGETEGLSNSPTANTGQDETLTASAKRRKGKADRKCIMGKQVEVGLWCPGLCLGL